MTIKQSNSRDYNIISSLSFLFIPITIFICTSHIFLDSNFEIKEGYYEAFYCFVFLLILFTIIVIYKNVKERVYYRVISKIEIQESLEKIEFIVLRKCSTKSINSVTKTKISSWEMIKFFDNEKEAFEYFRNKTSKKTIKFKDIPTAN